MKTEHIKILIFAIAISFVMVVAFYIYFGEAKVENEKGLCNQKVTVNRANSNFRNYVVTVSEMKNYISENWR